MPFEVGAYVKLSELQDDRYALIQSQSDLEDVLLSQPNVQSRKLYVPDNVSGAIVATSDGDYDEIWLTESSRYFDLNADYVRVH